MLRRSEQQHSKSNGTYSHSEGIGASSSHVPLVPPGLGLEVCSDLSDAPRSHLTPWLQERLGISTSPPRAPDPPTLLTFTVADSTKATYGPGFHIQDVVTGFESNRIFIENLPARATFLDVTSVIEIYGKVASVELLEKGGRYPTTTARATFADHRAASEAATMLDGATLFGRTVSVRLGSHKSTSLGHGTIHDTDVLLQFPSPHRTGYVGYESKELAEAAIQAAHNTELRGAWVTANIHKGLPMVGFVTVRFWGLPPDATKEDLFKYQTNNLGAMFEKPNYSSLAGATQGLRKYVATFGELISFNVLPPPYKKQVVRAWAQFQTPQAAAKACQVIHNRTQARFGNYKVYARHIKALTYTIPADVFDTIESDLARLRSQFCDNESGTMVSVQDRRKITGNVPPVTIKLASESLQILTKLKAAFDHILKGEKVVDNGEIVWDGFFSRAAGISYLDDLERIHRGIRINRDIRRRTLALFGPAHLRNRVRSAILAKIASLRSQTTRSLVIPVNLIGLFMSADLVKLQEEIGEENVTIDLTRRILRVRGDEDAYKVARLAIMSARDRHHTPRLSGQESCPVCLDKVKSPVTLRCGHTWCHSCLSSYLIASIDSKVFPLTCLGNEATCTEHIALDVAQELLSPNQFDAVLKAAFLAYIQSHPSEFFYCPTPDCEQIYRKAPPGTILQCPSCLVRICATCHFEAHESGKCPDMDTEDQQKFNDWKRHHDVKGCPSCRAPIERTDGCNHMTCAHCKTHICWECLATFEKGEEVYQHMVATHGNIGGFDGL